MGYYTERFWISDVSGMNKTERLGGVYRPYTPDLLYDSEIVLSPACAASVAHAESMLTELRLSQSLTDTEPLARMLLRSEAISSSRIEGLEMPASKLLEYEELDRLGVEHRLDSTEAQILGNLHMLGESLDAIEEGHEISLEEICSLNAVLLKGTRLAEQGGRLRTLQNWIGGNRVNPVGAAYVPPEPEKVLGLMEDLVAFLHSSELPILAIAALAHAQIEHIHPFADGNGRVGRALIHMVFKSRGLSRATVPPISLVLATDKERYIANLSATRIAEEDDWQGAMNDWIEYFANATILACRRAMQFEQTLSGIRDSWLSRTDFRSGSAARQLIDILPGTPALSIKTAQILTEKSYPAARAAVLSLVEAGILFQNAKNRKSGIYVANDVLEAFNAYERALATLSGDTSWEKPRRPVPQRKPKQE